MQVPPMAMVGDPDILGEAFQRVRFHDRDGERQRTVRGRYHATVAIGLFDVILRGLDTYLRISYHLCILLDRP